MIAMSVPVSVSTSVMSSPSLMVAASSSLTETVTGIGQKVPSDMAMSLHTPFQSSPVMKPSSGVNPPMPIMMASPVSRDVMAKRFSDAARFRSSFSSPPFNSRGMSFFSLPCGLTS